MRAGIGADNTGSFRDTEPEPAVVKRITEHKDGFDRVLRAVRETSPNQNCPNATALTIDLRAHRSQRRCAESARFRGQPAEHRMTNDLTVFDGSQFGDHISVRTQPGDNGGLAVARAVACLKGRRV